MAFLSGIGDFLFGKSGGAQQFDRFTPEQSSALNQILQQAMSGMQDSQFDFAPIEEQARSQFRTQTVPSIAERFSGMGAGGQRSSAFQSALGRAGGGLEEGLASMKSQYGMQKQGMLQNLLGMGLTPQFESAYMQRQPGFAESSITQILPMLIKYLAGGQ